MNNKTIIDLMKPLQDKNNIIMDDFINNMENNISSLHWKLTDKIPTVEEYQELYSLLLILIDMDTYNKPLKFGLCDLSWDYNLHKAKRFIESFMTYFNKSYMAETETIQPRIQWLQHYISNYEKINTYEK